MAIDGIENPEEREEMFKDEIWRFRESVTAYVHRISIESAEREIKLYLSEISEIADGDSRVDRDIWQMWHKAIFYQRLNEKFIGEYIAESDYYLYGGDSIDGDVGLEYLTAQLPDSALVERWKKVLEEDFLLGLE